MNKANRQAPVQPGERVNQYEILEELGRGGMGVVFKARDTNLDRDVALKCPWPEHLEEPKFFERFMRECRASAGISHPNVVPVLEVFESNGIPWLALGLVDGVSLGANINGPLEVKRVLKYAEDIAKGLDAAHKNRILHRDLTPNNVLIDQDGRALLMDFGLARFMLEPSTPDDMTQPMSLTTEGVVMGTLQYMSPEQALGKPLDVRSDIFSFGSVLYEMCTGSPPFTAHERGQILDAVIHHEPAPISRFTYEVPAELEWIVRKCLAKQPEERYQGTQDLLVDLKSLRKQTELGAISGSGSRAATRPSLPSFGATEAKPKRNPLLWILPLLAVAAAAAFWFSRPKISPIPTNYQPTKVTSFAGWEGEPALSPDGSRVAYAGVVNDNMDIYVVDVKTGEQLQLTTNPEMDYQPAWFPDGSFVVFSSRRSGKPGIWKVGQYGSDDPIELIPEGEEPAVSPDGTMLAFTYPRYREGCRIAVAQIGSPNEPDILTGEEDAGWLHQHPTWSANGKSIYYATQSDLWSINLSDRKPKPLTINGIVDAFPVSSPTGNRVYFSSYRQNTLAIWSIEGAGQEPRRLTPGTGPESHPSLSTDGQTLAYTSALTNHEILLRHLPSGRTSVIGSAEDEWQPALAQDGSFLVFVSSRVGNRLDLWRQNLSDGAPVGAPTKLTDGPGIASTPSISPDGKWIAYYQILDNQRDIHILPSQGGATRQLTNHPADDIHPSWSPDGSELAFVSSRSGNDQIWVVPIHNGDKTAEPKQLTKGEPKLAPQWSPDGKSIAVLDGRKISILDLDSETITTFIENAHLYRFHWDPQRPGFYVSGKWGESEIGLRRWDSSGKPDNDWIEIPFENLTHTPEFAITRDGSVVAHAFGELRGDIWVLNSDSPF